jgi:DNA-binding protein H-NS
MATKLDELQQQIDKLQKERDDLLAKEKAKAIEQINAMIAAFEITVDDLDIEYPEPRRFAPRERSRGTVPVKYKSGGNTWSGRGRKPKWVEDHVAKGGKLDDLLVK